jgi:hypothetical protein
VLNQDKSDFTQEIMNMENLRHENIVQLYGLSFDQKKRACIVSFKVFQQGVKWAGDTCA